MNKPQIKMSWHGIRGNMWRAWDVIGIDGKVYHHKSRTEAYRQYNAGMRLYNKKKMRR